MLKAIVMLGVGLAAVAVGRFAMDAVADERRRRGESHDSLDATRWEGEGGNSVMPANAPADEAAAYV